jgi:hypothetical protein
MKTLLYYNNVLIVVFLYRKDLKNSTNQILAKNIIPGFITEISCIPFLSFGLLF